MNTKLTTFIILTSVSIMGCNANNGLVWRIEANGKESYIVGVAHASLKEDYEAGLPKPVSKALSSAKTVFIESSVFHYTSDGKIDSKKLLEELPARYPKLKITEQLMHEAPQGIAKILDENINKSALENDLLSPDFIKKLQETLDSDDYYRKLEKLDFIKKSLAASSPFWLAYQIDTLYCTKWYNTHHISITPGLEIIIIQNAFKEKKPVKLLETYPEFIDALNNIMSQNGGIIVHLSKILDERKEPSSCGKLLKILHIPYEGMENKMNESYDQMIKENYMIRNIVGPSIPERNKKWMDKITPALNSEECPCLIVVGMYHLVGKEGLLNLLKGKGYTLTKLEG